MKKKIYPPGILQYIPIFYVIWSDDLLSTSEINVVEKAIKEDSSLDGNHRKILNSWLKVENPPSSTEFKQWSQLISASKVKLIESEIYPLATFSQKVVCTYHEVCPFNEHLKEIEIKR